MARSSKRPARRVTKGLRKQSRSTATDPRSRVEVALAALGLTPTGATEAETIRAIASRAKLSPRHVGILLYHLRRAKETTARNLLHKRNTSDAAHDATALAANDAGSMAASLTRLTQIRSALLDKLAAIDLVLGLLK